MTTGQEMAVAERAAIATSGPLRPEDLARQVKLVQEVMAAVMKKDEHYGVIPGTNKPTLLQPGAQVLALTFRLAPDFFIDMSDLGNGHREYMIRCRLASITSGEFVGMGVGSCSTMESKYRYRNVSDFEVTGERIPDDYKTQKKEYRKQGFGAKQVDGQWEWVKYGDTGRVENPDIADTWNTVLKMATKRAFIHAVLNATGASDMFTQDLEDYREMDSPKVAQKVDASTLTEIRALRVELEVSDDTYASQLEHYGASEDSELTSENAHRLLVTYRTRKERLAAENTEPEIVIEDDEIPF